jgi:hypothetical protein
MSLDRFLANRWWRPAVWIVFVTAWTIMLLVPVPDDLPVSLTGRDRFFVSKGVHVAAFAVLTIMAGWLHTGFRWRLFLLFFLMAHAAVTEWLQTKLSYRTGQVSDVVLDHCGIAIGLLLSWKWWMSER